MYRFDYHKAKNIQDAARHYEKADDGVYIAGGMTLIPALKLRLASPSDLVDLAAIPDLQGIDTKEDCVIIGAMTRHADVAASPEIRAKIPALADLAGGIGNPQVRNRGTLGGSIANNDPAADYPAGVLGLKAVIVTDRREIAADDFFTGMFETALDEGEIITAVRFPIPKRAAYAKFPNPVSRYAIVGVFVADMDEGVRVAVTGAGSCVFRITEMEEAFGGSLAPDSVKTVKITPDEFNTDLHASAEYRAHLIKVMAGRAVEKIMK